MSYLGVGQARSDLVILIQHHIEPLAHLVREQELLRLLPQPLGLGQQLTNEKRVLRDTALLVVPAQVPSPAVVAQAVALGLVHHVAHQVLPGRWSPNSLILTLSNQWSGI